MSAFAYIVTVETESQKAADRIMEERLGYEEPYYEDEDGDWWNDSFYSTWPDLDEVLRPIEYTIAWTRGTGMTRPT